MASLQAQLVHSQRWWQYFRRREVQRRLQAVQGEAVLAEGQLQQARAQLQEIEEQGGARYPGLSLQARRTLNLMAIACAQLQALRLAPSTLLPRCVEAMSRSEPRIDPGAEAAGALALMQDVARAKAAMIQASAAIQADVRRLADHLAAQVRYGRDSDVLPHEGSVQSALGTAVGRGERMSWNVLTDDLWGLSDLFYGVED
jgi:hypothetical protein